MKLCPHTFESIARALVSGLEDGTILLRSEEKVVQASERRWDAQQQAHAFEREVAAFQAMLPVLQTTYEGSFVAISDGQIIDVDVDQHTLLSRVSRQAAHAFVLVQQVVLGAQPEVSVDTTGG
jgi:hypothetical protein